MSTGTSSPGAGLRPALEAVDHGVKMSSAAEYRRLIFAPWSSVQRRVAPPANAVLFGWAVRPSV